MKINGDYQIIEIEDGFAAFSATPGGFLGMIRMNESARTMFELLTCGLEEPEALCLLRKIYGSEEEDLRAALRMVAEELLKNGVLKPEKDINPRSFDAADRCGTAFAPAEILFLPSEPEQENYADRNTGCYYNSCDCFSYDDCWTK